MKLIKLELTNINSLRGNHVIDFTQPPLSGSGLFLISGPTGSGKSSILDAITLALFNRIPRFGQPFSKEKMKKEGSVVTHFEDHAMAAVTYESGDQVYKSTWSIKKNRNDNWNNYEMSIHKLPEMELMDLQHRRQIPEENEKIIGLNYEQFLKSIVLAQGDFAEFLKADHHTRGRLLEKITGTEIYRIAGKLAYEKAKDITQEIDLLKQEINLIPILEDEFVSQIQSELTGYENNILKLKKSIDKLERSKNQLERLKENEAQIHSLSITLEQYKEKIENFRIKKQKLDLHNQMLPLKGEILLIEQKNKDLSKLFAQKENTLQALTKASVLLANALSKGSRFAKKEIKENDFPAIIKSLESAYNTLSTKANLCKESGEKIRNSIYALEDQRIDERLKHKLPASKALDILNELLDSFNVKKEILGIGNDDIQGQIKILSDNKISLKTYLDVSGTYAEQSLEKDKIDKQINFLQKSITTAGAKETELAEIIKSLNSAVSKKEEEQTENQKKLNFKDFRAELKSGEPCPLCGALDHPYSQHNVIFEEGKLSFEILALKKDLSEKQKELMTISNAMASDRSTLTIRQEQSKKLADSLKMLEEQLKNTETSFTHQNTDDLHSELQKLTDRLDQLNKLASEENLIPLYQNLKSKYEELEEIFREYQSLYIQLKDIYAGDDFNKKVEALQNEFSKAVSDINLYQEQIKTFEKEQIDLKNRRDQQQKALLPKLQKLNISSIEESLSHMLDETAAEAWAQEYEQDVLKKNEIESNIKQLRDNQLKLKEEIEKDETLSEILEALREKQKQRDELQINLGKLNQQLDNNTQNIQNKKEKERILTLKEGNNKKWYELNALIGDASGNRFANYAQDLTLQSLIAITNKNLSLLTDRYLLVPTRIEETLSVYDTYQGDTIRAINTLSGGETFIVSLAMAVSLSELAAKNVRIQSIFIDEGFGSLDADSLEQAMSTLESWQSSSNKTIGIISHVASLKERISTQIHLERDHKGHSQLKIVS